VFHAEPASNAPQPTPRGASCVVCPVSKPQGSPDGPSAAVLPADSRRVGHARSGRPPGCSGAPLRRPPTRMPRCFTWNRRQCPGVAGSGHPAVVSDGGGAAVPADCRLSIRLARFHVRPRRSSAALLLSPADPDARTGRMFHVEPEVVSGGMAPSDSDARTGPSRKRAQRSAPALRSSPRMLTAFRSWVDLRPCLRAGAARPGRSDAVDVSRETGGRVLSDDALVRAPGPVESLRRDEGALWLTLADPDVHRPSGFTWNRAEIPAVPPGSHTPA